jgi:hypothetical protein
MIKEVTGKALNPKRFIVEQVKKIRAAVGEGRYRRIHGLPSPRRRSDEG